MNHCTAVFISILSASLVLACSAINPPSLTDIEGREADIASRVEELDQLGYKAESYPECQIVLEQFAEKMERRTILLEIAWGKMILDSADAQRRSEVYDLMGQVLELLDEVEPDLLACIPPTQTPNPGEQAWLEFEEWFRSIRDSLVYLDIIPRFPECSQVPPDGYFGIFVSANNILQSSGISYGEVVDVKFWESRYRTDGDDPSEFRALITGMVGEIEYAVRDACLDALQALPQSLSPTEAPMPPTVGRSEPTLVPSSEPTLVPSSEPTLVPTSEPLTFTRVTSGHSFSCGIVSSGSVVCWGDNREGQTTPPLGSFLSISANGSRICGVKEDRTLVCWGHQDPRYGTPPVGSFRSVSVGDLHACGVTSNDSALCWGYNESGQAGPPKESFTSVSAGGYHTCGVTTEGSAICWGVDYGGRATPPSGSYDYVDAGQWHTCGVMAGGSVVCWGDNGEGDNGEGRAAPPDGTFLSVSANTDHTCGLKADGMVSCWGYDHFGQSTPLSDSFVSISAGSYHTCGIKTDGVVSCWGYDDSGEATPPR